MVEQAFRDSFRPLALDVLFSEKQFAHYDRDNSKCHLFKTIEKTEAKLTALAKQAATRAKQVEQK